MASNCTVRRSMILFIMVVLLPATSLAWMGGPPTTGVTCRGLSSSPFAYTLLSPAQPQRCYSLKAKAGSFFNQVPDPEESSEDPDEIPTGVEDVLKHHRKPSEAQIASTMLGVPFINAGKGYARPMEKKNAVQITQLKSSKTYIGIGPPSLNDVNNPAVDDQGYTLYTDEQTGEKSRVFEALVDYPCLFTLKIVGANDGSFVTDMLSIVATTCEVEFAVELEHTVKVNGKWTSVTVKAPVKSATMLYELYENVDQDPRVKFKF